MTFFRFVPFFLLAAMTFAEEGLNSKEVIHLKEPVTRHEAEHPSAEIAPDTNVGGGTAVNPEQQIQETVHLQENALRNSDADSLAMNADSTDSAEVSDSEPEESLEDQDVALEDSTALPDTLYIDMEKASLPTTNMRITSPFGLRHYRIHKGLDVKVQVGDTIRAAFPGVVTRSSYERRGYGNFIMIKHTDCGITKTVYGHLSKRLVSVGEEVKAGDPIGLGGNTGRSTGSHLHFETRINDIPLDPARFFDFENQRFTANVYALSLEHTKADYALLQKEASRHRFYRVRPGDNLGKIARKYGTSIRRLCQLNGIKRTTVLRIGRMLRCS